MSMSDPEGDGGMDAVQQEFRDVPETASDELRRAGQFLLDRLNEYEPDFHDHVSDYMGHVEPAIARFRSALARAPAPAVGDVAELIERLKAEARYVDTEYHGTALLMKEAASSLAEAEERERVLREALTKIGSRGLSYSERYGIARAALGEKP